MAVSLTDVVSYKRLVAAGNNQIWYEDLSVATGTMVELDTSSGAINTTDQLNMFEGYQKVFIVNGSNFKVADFTNTKIVDASNFTNKPAKGDIVYQNGSAPAQMVVDYIDSANDVMYGYVISGTFEVTTAITTVVGGAGDVIFPSPAAPVSSPHWYDWTPYDNDTGTYGALPNKAYIGCLYRGRCVISGNPEYPYQWYMSRQANPWDFAYVANDAGTPVAGGNSDAGELGDMIRALIPYKDDYLIFGCATSIWFLAGDPAEGGSINELDLTTGMFGANSWCFDGDGNLFFWGTNGIYVTPIPGTPTCISEIRLPNLVNDEVVDPSTYRITMAYARKRKGILICITKLSDGTNSNYWYDLRSGGFFPESYPDECGVYSAFYYAANSNSYRDLLVGCKDGYIRKFDASAKDDNKGASDQAINSYVKFGPISMFSEDPDKQGKITGLNLITAGGGANGSQSDSDDVNFRVYTAKSAEEVIEKLSADTNPQIAGIFKAPGRQPGTRRNQKAKGAYLGVRLDNIASDKVWGFERLVGTVLPSGRIK